MAAGGGTSTQSTISGRVADGYIKGATVFWDCNGDHVLNSNEISTTSNIGGSFTIQAAPPGTCQLAAYIPVGAIDEDHPTQPIDRPYTLIAAAGNEQFISPLSTIVSTYIAENPSASISDASKVVADFLGVSGNVLNDYIAETGADSARRHAVAQAVAVILQNNNMNGAIDASLSNALANTKSLAPSIASADLSTSANIEAFLNPLRAFLKPLEPPKFSKATSDKYKVRPNNNIGLNDTQKTVLRNIIALPAIQRVTRWGIIHWSELTNAEFDEAYGLLQGSNILADENDGVMAIRAERTKFLQDTSDYFNQRIASKTYLFSHDIGTNFQYFASAIMLPGFEAVGGAVSTATGLPSPDLRHYRGQPILKGVIKVTTQPAIKDVVVALLSAVTFPAETKAKIDSALAKGDTEAFSQAEFEAFADVTDQLINIEKDILKSGKLGKAGELFGPALKLYGVTQECSASSSLIGQNSECFSASLEILETVTEWAHMPPRVHGALQWIRATFDAYSKGKEYAEVTNDQISVARDKVLADWDARVNGMKLVFKQMEFSYGGYDKYFEAYDPTVQCSAGTTLNATGECVAVMPSASWCNQTLTFDNNLLPANWTSTLIRSGPGVWNNRMEAAPTDSGVYITAADGAMDAGVSAVIVEFDNSRSYSYWGQFNQVTFKTSAGKSWYFGDGNFLYRGGSREFTSYLSNQSPYTNGGTVEFNQVLSDGSLGFGQFKTRLTLRDGRAEWLLTDATGTVKSINMGLAPEFKISDLVAPTVAVYTTTDGAAWIDNLSLQCVR